ncbi:MAG: winged helix-turn-helix domain-containing protein [Acidobacteriia bacterium]|nr:winged helix-turn-helix domain-containing protein [Terriglobia bacterium]
MDLEAFELRKNGRKLRLLGQPFQVLRVLLEQAGRVVTRQDLRSKLWPATEVEFDHGLNNAILKLREALDDSATAPRFIETIPRVGYRFLAPVEVIAQTQDGRHPHTSSPVAISPAGAVDSPTPEAGVPGVSSSSLSHPPAAGTEGTSIAVLSFRSISGGAKNNHLAAGLASEVIHALTGVPGLRVAPQRTSFQLGSEAVDPLMVARTLNTRYVVTGEVRHSGRRLRVAVQLVDAITERVTWAQKYDCQMTEIFEMQDDISKAIVRSLGGHLIRAVTDSAYRAPTASLNAWGLVQKARHIYTNEFSPAGVRQAISLLRRALEMDPNYGVASAYLGMSLMQSVLHGISQDVQGDCAEALAAAEHAYGLAPDESEVLAFCSLVWLPNGRYERAVQCLQRCVKIAPFGLAAWGYLGLAHAIAGGEKEVQAAHKILSQLLVDAPDHPGVPYWLGSLAVANLRLGRLEEALDIARRAVELQPGFTLYRVFYAEALCRCGQKEESLKVLSGIQDYSPGFTLAHFEKIAIGFARSADIVEKLCGCVKVFQNSVPSK